MPKDQKPRRRRKTDSPPADQPRGELQPAPRPEVVVRTRPPAATPPIVARLAEGIRAVAVALMDIADAAAESLTKALSAS